MQVAFPAEQTREFFIDWANVPVGAIVVINMGRFGYAKSQIVASIDFDTRTADVVPISVCYDKNTDTFLLSNESPELNYDACKCYIGQGYSACACISNATDSEAVVKWFREHPATTYRGDVQWSSIPFDNIRLGSTCWYEVLDRASAAQMFEPRFISFCQLCL